MIPAEKILRYSLFFLAIVVLAVPVIYFSNLISFEKFLSLFIPIIITSLNYLLGFLAIKFGINKSQKVFLISILGGMVFRLLMMVILVFISLKFLEISRNSFIFTIFFFYVFYLIMEVFYLNTKKNN